MNMLSPSLRLHLCTLSCLAVDFSSVFDIVTSKKILGVGHCFELKVVATWIFEKHGPLFTRLSFKSKCWFNNEVNACLLHSFRKLMKLLHRQGKSRVWNGYFISINWIVVVLTTIVTSSKVTYNLMPAETVVLPFVGTSAFCTAYNLSVKVLGNFQIVYRKGVVKG